MFHPGFLRCRSQDFLWNGGFHLKHYPADHAGATACSALQIRRAIESVRVRLVIFSTQRSPISSRVSQNAAALLFDLGTVDIR
jgi:hypothetical protein